MAVVAVLLNSKLYVANVGEPPSCPRVGVLDERRSASRSVCSLGSLLPRHISPPACVS